MPFGPAHLVHTDALPVANPTGSGIETGATEPVGAVRSFSSAVERHVHIVDVVGSIPTTTTISSSLVAAERLEVLPIKRRTQRGRTVTGRVNKPATYRGFPVRPLVYFVQAHALRLIKIGSTVDVGDRLRILQTGSPDKLELVGAICSDDAFRLEEDLHHRFAAHREHGEWFQPAAALLELIARWPLERIFEGEREKANRILSGVAAFVPPGSH